MSSQSAVSWFCMASTVAITLGMLAGYSQQTWQSIKAGSSHQHMRFLYQLVAVAFILIFADVFNLCENYFFFARIENPTVENSKQNILFGLLKTIFLAIGSFLHTTVGLERLSLFDHLFTQLWMRRVPKILIYASCVLMCFHISVSLAGKTSRLANYPDPGNAADNISVPTSWFNFMWVGAMHVFVDATIIYFVLKVKTSVVQSDKRMLHDMRVIITLLCCNVVILLLGPALAALNSASFNGGLFRGIGEFVYRVYIAGNIFCFQQLKRFSNLKGGSATIAQSATIPQTVNLGKSKGESEIGPTVA
ncbi:hypothetical protein BKA69DRAFT_1058213 [Paraphysoderma sedebokerense]|nr:hypothetical protein BKA69DRAFT_1058213 [Paraphysoderma sedebokerense]